MNHAVLGAGGIGGFIGGAIARAGFPVTMIVRPDAIPGHPTTLSVSSRLLGDFEAPIRLTSELTEGVDVLWVTVKATQLDSAMSAVPADRVGSALIVPLLNGVEHIVKLRSVYVHERVIVGMIRVESERLAPGEIRQLSPFGTMGLAASGEHLGKVVRLCDEVETAGLLCEVVDDEQSLLWRKLAFLAPLALTTTAKPGTLGEIRDDPLWSRRLQACVNEACTVASLEGAKVDQAGIMDFLHGAPAAMRSSMQKDVEAGRQPEVDAIGGPIVRLGRRHGVDVPVTEELIEKIVTSPIAT